MADANAVYEAVKDWGSAVRLGISGTQILLQVLVAKNVLTTEEALLIVDDLAKIGAQQTSTSEVQRTIVAASYDQVRQSLHQ